MHVLHALQNRSDLCPVLLSCSIQEAVQVRGRVDRASFHLVSWVSEIVRAGVAAAGEDAATDWPVMLWHLRVVLLGHREGIWVLPLA